MHVMTILYYTSRSAATTYLIISMEEYLALDRPEP